MADQFLGMTVLVTLIDPRGAQLRGIVDSIIPKVSLTLRDVSSPSTNRTVPEYTIDVKNIQTLETENVNASLQETSNPVLTDTSAVEEAVPVDVTPSEPKITTTSTVNPERSPIRQPQIPMVQNISKFGDPAILSMGKRPSIIRTLRGPSENVSPKAAYTNMSGQSFKPHSKVFASLQKAGKEEQIKRQSSPPSPAANLIDPGSFSRGDFKPKRDDPARDGKSKVSPYNMNSLSKNLPDNSVSKARRPRKRRNQKTREEIADPGIVTPARETKPSKGWRQTPLLQPTSSFQPYSTLRKPNKAQRNGWGTEDASDVQEMGDFDFEGNLMKFDKPAIFDQIKAADMTADEDRLVSHNQRPKPGTAGGKNLHNTENVLDVPSGSNAKAMWNSEAGDSDEELASHMGSHKGSSSLPPSRPQTSFTPSLKSAFYLTNANRKCEVVSALQALNLENIANSELGLTEDMMTENAGRGIAEVALTALSTGNRRLSLADAAMPTVVIFAGNNKSGQRAVAAGRHLRNHGVHVIVCVLGLEREPELLEDLRRQLKVFRNFGGKVFKKVDMLAHLKTLDSSIELIIDGLLGLTMTIEELRMGDQATAFELITWANTSKANVLAIDIPSGIDPTTGKVAIIEGWELHLRARYIVSLSAPKRGLLHAMMAGHGQDWQLFVADIGIADAAWKKAGTRMRRGVEFDQDWVVGLRFQLA